MVDGESKTRNESDETRKDGGRDSLWYESIQATAAPVYSQRKCVRPVNFVVMGGGNHLLCRFPKVKREKIYMTNLGKVFSTYGCLLKSCICGRAQKDGSVFYK